MMLSKNRKTKALIRLRGCAGWSEPFLFAPPPPPRRQVLSRQGPFIERARLPVLVRLKLHDPWICTLLHNPWVCTIISMLVLHDSWVCTIILLGSWVCTTINMCDPSVRPWSASENAHHGLCTFAHYCQLILCRISIELIQTIQFEEELTGTL